MNKKVIAAGMAMVLASMGLTACGDSGSKEAKDSSDETYTVTMAYIGDKEEDTDRIEKKINEIMKKDINMELDIEPISWGAYAETMKLILSGGEKMDIVPILVEQVNSMQKIFIKKQGFLQFLLPEVPGHSFILQIQLSRWTITFQKERSITLL